MIALIAATLILAASTILTPGYAQRGDDRAEQQEQNQERKARLPGSRLPEQEAFDECDLVVSAELVKLGVGRPGPSGCTRYNQARFRVLKSLKGELSGERDVSLRIQTFPKDVAETIPQEGQRYLLFLQQPNDVQLWGIKMLSASEENIRAIEMNVADDRLPGNRLGIQEAFEGSKLIAIAELADLGDRKPGLNGKINYPDARFRILMSYNGDVRGERHVYLTVSHVPKDRPEAEPKPGRRYLLFLKESEGQSFWAVKVIPASEKNITAVRKLLESSRSPDSSHGNP